MTAGKDRKRRGALDEIDVRLGGLVDEIGAALGEMLDRLEQGGAGEIRRERDFSSPDGTFRAETGVRIRIAGAAPRGGASGGARVRPADPAARDDTGPARGGTGRQPGRSRARGDRATATPDATVRERPSDGAAAAPRPIDAEIVVSEGVWSLTADLPGLAPEDLVIESAPDGVIVSGAARGRTYRARFDLPDGVSVGDLDVAVHNGILELRAVLPEPRE